MRRARAVLALLAVPGALAAQSVGAVPPAAVLERPVTITVRDATLSSVLGRLRHEHGLPLAWSGDLLPVGLRVSLSLREEPLGATLRRILEGSGLDYAVTAGGTVVIVPRRETPAADVASPSRVHLATGVRQLDQIVVMGSPVGRAPEREQATATSVAGHRKLAESPFPRLVDQVRTLLPGLVLWDRGPAGPPAQIASIRGVSSFSTRGLKTYIDDIELASPDLFTLLDGRSVEQLELLRGPQGAALYGPDALNGILQIVTRKGQPGSGVTGTAGASGGAFERPDLDGAALWQDHAVRLGGGAAQVSGELHGSYTRTGATAEVPWLSSWTAHGGWRGVAGPVVITGSARAGRYEYGAERPTLNGVPPSSSVPMELEERGLGLTIRHAAGTNWRQALMAGHHWISGAREPSRSLLVAPRLPLGATHETAWRNSIRYAATGDIPIRGHELSLSAGAEHSRRHVDRAERRTSPVAALRPLYDDDQRSTGGFGQARLRLGSKLTLSGGSRVEWLSSVGEDTGPAWASTAGMSWSRPLGLTTLRLRGAWGRGLRAPEPGMSRGMATIGVRQLPNPDLAPESQRGIEAGIELHRGEAAFLGLTWYDQRADDLIQQVQLRTGDLDARVYQFQNVGAIANRGVEIEAGLRQGTVMVTGSLFLNRSEVVRLARGYTGDLRPGDDVPEVPDGVGTIALTWRRGPLSAELGSSWIGTWTGYDWRVIEAGTVRATDREYWIRYPSVWRPWIAASLVLGRGWRTFMRVDNPGNTEARVRDNLTPPLGRTSVIGVELTP